MSRCICLFFLIVCPLMAQDKFLPEEEMLEDCGPTYPISLSRAIEITLREQADIEIAQLDVYSQQGKVQESTGPFDPVLEVTAEFGYLDNVQSVGNRTNRSGHETSLTAKAKKEMRVGTKATISARAKEKKDALKSKTCAASEFCEGGVSFRIDQPVLKGFRCGSNAINELAARQTLRSTCYDALHKISREILNTTLVYWDVAAKRDILNIRQEAEERFDKLVEITYQLIEDGKMDKEKLNQPLAQLATARIERAISEQELYSSIQSLKMTIGIVDPDWNGDKLLDPIDPFPNSKADIAKLCQRSMDELVDLALQNRLDILASYLREDVARTNLQGSFNQCLPKLDFFAEVKIGDHACSQNYTSIGSAVCFTKPQKDWAVGVAFSTPFCNDGAKGSVRQNRSNLRQSILKTQDLKEQVITKVLDTWTKHLRAISQLGNAKGAVDKFRSLVEDNENKITEEGILFELINFQNNLTSAEITYTRLLQSIAKNMAQVRFDTGTLLSPDTDLECIFIEDLTSLPIEG